MGYSSDVHRGPTPVEPQRRTGFRRLAPALTPIRGRDIAAGIRGQYRGTGREEFRETIRGFLDGTSAGTYTSFRTALVTCLKRLSGENDRSLLAVPAFCSNDYRVAIDRTDLERRRYDVDPTTLAADLGSLGSLPLDDVLAVVVVNVLGYGSAMEEIKALCDEHGVLVVEALGYSLGATYDGQRLGTVGDCSLLNFQQGKPVPVGGGMVVSHRESIAFDDARPAVGPNLTALTGYSLLGHPRAYYWYVRTLAPLATRLGRSVDTHPESKDGAVDAGPPKTMSNFQGTIGKRVFDRLGRNRRSRALTAQFYRQELDGVAGISHPTPIQGLGNHQYVRYPLCVEDRKLRSAIHDALAEAGVETRRLYDWPEIEGDAFPGAARLQREILTLPTHPYVSKSDRKRIVATIRAVVRSRHDPRRSIPAKRVPDDG